MGPVHVISISTEYFFFINYGILQPIHMYEWLEKDLQEASKPENRAKQPWIIAMGHRPMYCSNNDHDDCTHHESLVSFSLMY
uniref:Iron/zinc purple acid phosphatase-like protein n=1 Tax=Magallana gigas TaxID=29159 RepID=K1PFZ3_MAGGI